MNNFKKRIDLFTAMKYFMVGTLNTLVDFVIFSLCFYVIGISLTVSQILGYLISMINSYFINRNFTFKQQGRSSIFEFSKFTIINLIALSTSVLLINLFVLIGIEPFYSKGMVTIIAGTLNFLGQNLITFKDNH